LIEIGSKTAEKNFAQTNRQTDRHYENNGHLGREPIIFWIKKQQQNQLTTTKVSLWVKAHNI